MRFYFEPHPNGCGAAIWERFHGHRSARNYTGIVDALEAFAVLLCGPRCVECDEPIRYGYADDTEAEMRANGVCCDCAGWLRYIDCTDRYTVGPFKRRMINRRVVAGGRYYQVEPDLPANYRDCAGYGGTELTIRFHDGSTLVTRNLWDRGEIPACFRERLPDNASIEALR